jgi:hypothetical protein
MYSRFYFSFSLHSGGLQSLFWRLGSTDQGREGLLRTVRSVAGEEERKKKKKRGGGGGYCEEDANLATSV